MTPHQSLFHTVTEVAVWLGVSTRSVHRWIADGELIAHRFGRAVRIAETDLKAFLDARECGEIRTRTASESVTGRPAGPAGRFPGAIPVFYDCEATSLSGLPIEIGWAFVDP